MIGRLLLVHLSLILVLFRMQELAYLLIWLAVGSDHTWIDIHIPLLFQNLLYLNLVLLLRVLLFLFLEALLLSGYGLDYFHLLEVRILFDSAFV